MGNWEVWQCSKIKGYLPFCRAMRAMRDMQNLFSLRRNGMRSLIGGKVWVAMGSNWSKIEGLVAANRSYIWRIQAIDVYFVYATKRRGIPNSLVKNAGLVVANNSYIWLLNKLMSILCMLCYSREIPNKEWWINRCYILIIQGIGVILCTPATLAYVEKIPTTIRTLHNTRIDWTRAQTFHIFT